MTNPPTKPPGLGSNQWMPDDRAGQIVTNVIELRARSFDALPGIFACCLDNPEDYFAGEFEEVLLARHAQEMFKASATALNRAMGGLPLTREDIKTLTWLRSACSSFVDGLESLSNNGHLWVPDEVERALVPFDEECPF